MICYIYCYFYDLLLYICIIFVAFYFNSNKINDIFERNVSNVDLCYVK